MTYPDNWSPQTGNLPSGVPAPQETLGYGILRWCSKYIITPDGKRAGKPWQFTNEQKKFILWAYALKSREDWPTGDDESYFLYTNISLRRAKGWRLG